MGRRRLRRKASPMPAASESKVSAPVVPGMKGEASTSPQATAANTKYALRVARVEGWLAAAPGPGAAVAGVVAVGAGGAGT